MHWPYRSVAPSFCIYKTRHNPQFLDSLRRRANARNVSFRISLRWPIHIINSVDKTKLSCVSTSSLLSLACVAGGLVEPERARHDAARSLVRDTKTQATPRRSFSRNTLCSLDFYTVLNRQLHRLLFIYFLSQRPCSF